MALANRAWRTWVSSVMAALSLIAPTRDTTRPGIDSPTGISDRTTIRFIPAHAATRMTSPTTHAAMPSPPPRRSRGEPAANPYTPPAGVEAVEVPAVGSRISLMGRDYKGELPASPAGAAHPSGGNLNLGGDLNREVTKDTKRCPTCDAASGNRRF